MDSLLSQNSNLNGMFQNSGYNFNREERKTLVIDLELDNTNASHKNSIELYEPLIIDKLSDIYLESFTTFNASANTSSNTAAFIISIDEFNIKSNSNTNASLSLSNVMSKTFNNIVIPNESGGLNKTIVHKSKKLNYICSINPSRLTNLNIKITDLEGDNIFNNPSRYILELVFVSRK
jgi:hypothetical protein